MLQYLLREEFSRIHPLITLYVFTWMLVTWVPTYLSVYVSTFTRTLVLTTLNDKREEAAETMGAEGSIDSFTDQR